jgi:hypothetical protein
MGDGGKFAIEVILVLVANIRLEIVAWDHKVGIKQDANGVINGCPLAINCE